MEREVKVPSGFRFVPKPEELLVDYLRPRLLNEPLPCQIIQDKNIYNFHPKVLLGNTPPGEHMYFFTPLQKRCPNGTRPARTTDGGWWKASTSEKVIRDEHGKEVGFKKFLVFHQGKQPKGVKTGWLMHEYTIKKFWLPTEYDENELGALALCEIYEKPDPKQRKNDKHQVEEKGSTSHCSGNEEDMDNMNDVGSLQNIHIDLRVRPHPTADSHVNKRAKSSVPSTSGCPTDSSPLEVTTVMGMPSPSMPFMAYNFHESHEMMPILQSSGDFCNMGYDSHQVRLLPPDYQDAHSSGFDDAGGLLQPEAFSILDGNSLPMPSVQLGASEHSLSLVPVSSLQFEDSASLPFNNGVMLLPEHMQLSESSVAANPSFPDQLLLDQLYFLASQHMPSSSQSSPPTNLWLPPLEQLDFNSLKQASKIIGTPRPTVQAPIARQL